MSTEFQNDLSDILPPKPTKPPKRESTLDTNKKHLGRITPPSEQPTIHIPVKPPKK